LPTGGIAVDRGERVGHPLVRFVVDVDQAEIVVLAVISAAFRMVVVLEPVRSDDPGKSGEIIDRGGGAVGAIRLGRDCHQVAIVAVSGAVLIGGEEPFGNQHRLAARQLFQPGKVVMRNPAVAAVGVVVGGDRVDVARHRAYRRRVVVDR
jgi:hypothetical protein